MWKLQVNSKRDVHEPKVKVHFSVLTFNQIQDISLRKRFNETPTTFRLLHSGVDTLADQGKILLKKSPEFNVFIEALETGEKKKYKGYVPAKCC
tara:strand:- start:13369 stop:13650 length:282 start_codon:yes stop_codon:yes gene_type:complete